MNRLTISNGPHQGRRFSLRDSEIMVGRGEQAGIRLEDPDVDDMHLVLHQQEDQLCIGSIVPGRVVLVNGTEAAEGTWLQPGDELQVGSTQLVFTNVRLHTGMSARRTGKMQRVTVGAIVIVLILEVLFILGFTLSQNDQSSLETLRQEEQVVEEKQAGEKQPETVEVLPPVFSINNANARYTFDDQNRFEICLIRLNFHSQRELTDQELEQVRVEGFFLEKVGTNAWSRSAGFMPSQDWPVHHRDQRRDRFYSLSTVLIPRDPVVDSDETGALSDPTVLGGTLRVYFGEELQDETKIKLQLKDRFNQPSPEA